MYRAIKKALPLSVCETDTTTVVEVDKGQRFITSVNYVLNLLSKSRFLYQSKIICKQNQHLLYIYKYNDKKQEKNLDHLILIRSSYRSRIANIRIHFEFAKKLWLVVFHQRHICLVT